MYWCMWAAELDAGKELRMRKVLALTRSCPARQRSWGTTLAFLVVNRVRTL